MRQYDNYSIIFSWKLMKAEFVLEIDDEFSVSRKTTRMLSHSWRKNTVVSRRKSANKWLIRRHTKQKRQTEWDRRYSIGFIIDEKRVAWRNDVSIRLRPRCSLTPTEPWVEILQKKLRFIICLFILYRLFCNRCIFLSTEHLIIWRHTSHHFAITCKRTKYTILSR